MAKIVPNLIKIGAHAYLSNGYLNQVSKLNFDKVDKPAYFQPWFDIPLISAKIAPNVIIIGFHAYLPNGHLNPLSKFNSDKVDKSTYFQPWFYQT